MTAMCTLCGSAEHTRSGCPWKDKLELLFDRPRTVPEALDQVERAVVAVHVATARLDRAVARLAAVRAIEKIRVTVKGTS